MLKQWKKMTIKKRMKKVEENDEEEKDENEPETPNKMILY